MIVAGRLIRPFVAPEFRVEPVGEPCDEGDLGLLAEGLRTGRAEILAANLEGHPPFTHILRYHYEDAATDFLVRIDTAGYLVRLPD